jgi:hypothetical protein
MAEGKHIILQNYIIILLIFFVLRATKAHAGAWLPEKGTYNLYSSHSYIDEHSRKARNMRRDLFIEMQTEIQKLSKIPPQIYRETDELQRPLLNSELRLIEEIKQDIEILEKEASELTSFNDENSSYFELEYGAAESHSFGTKIGYKQSCFADINSGKPNLTKSGQEIDIFYKYKVFNNENWIVTLRPKVHFSNFDKNKSLTHIDLELLVGKSTTKDNHRSYIEWGVGLRNYYGLVINNTISYVLSMQESMYIGKGFTLNNYTEYEKAKFINILYRRTIYDQISITREIVVDKPKLKCFTAQIGYFWKTSLVNRYYTLSGPTFSLWFNL